MSVVLNPLFSSCCKIGRRATGKFEPARGLNALASVKWDIWFDAIKRQLKRIAGNTVL